MDDLRPPFGVAAVPKEEEMRHFKKLAPAAVAAAAMIALVGSGTASADKLCSTTVDPCPGAAGQAWPAGTTLDFSVKPGTSANWNPTGIEEANI
jgi:hypothetical protein